GPGGARGVGVGSGRWLGLGRGGEASFGRTGFLAPLMLVGIVALAVPIAIHLIGRRRARVVKFAALDFLLATKRRTARRFRLRERLLFLVRGLVCVAIAIALAKPFTSCERKGPMVTRGPQAAVLVIDDSFASG